MITSLCRLTALITILLLSLVPRVCAQCTIDSVGIQSLLIDPTGNPFSFDTNRDGQVNSSDEFIEICNYSMATMVDISGWQIGDDDPPPYADFVIPTETILQPGECIILVNNYCPNDSLTGTPCEVPDGVIDMGLESALLGNSGDVITLANASGESSCSVTYGDVNCTDVDPLDIPPFSNGDCDYWGQDVDGCPLLAEGDSCSYLPLTLPLELISFSALALDDQRVQLEWIVAETESSYMFEVEWRSENMTAFSKIGEVSANDDGYLSYTFIHDTPLSGLNYYRLKEREITGTINYSDLRSVDIKLERQIRLIPNIVDQSMKINGQFDNYTISVFDISGKLIREKFLKRNNESIDLYHLQSGYYVARIFTGERYVTKKFFKI